MGKYSSIFKPALFDSGVAIAMMRWIILIMMIIISRVIPHQFNGSYWCLNSIHMIDSNNNKYNKYIYYYYYYYKLTTTSSQWHTIYLNPYFLSFFATAFFATSSFFIILYPSLTSFLSNFSVPICLQIFFWLWARYHIFHTFSKNVRG